MRFLSLSFLPVAFLAIETFSIPAHAPTGTMSTLLAPASDSAMAALCDTAPAWMRESSSGGPQFDECARLVNRGGCRNNTGASMAVRNTLTDASVRVTVNVRSSQGGSGTNRVYNLAAGETAPLGCTRTGTVPPRTIRFSIVGCERTSGATPGDTSCAQMVRRGGCRDDRGAAMAVRNNLSNRRVRVTIRVTNRSTGRSTNRVETLAAGETKSVGCTVSGTVPSHAISYAVAGCEPIGGAGDNAVATTPLARDPHREAVALYSPR